ncbi:MAG: hypothetical protein IPL84_00640 [Chitinophagaceae bacterium]|nr:hypothetical protein [Chitinophagaceae bacterium]
MVPVKQNGVAGKYGGRHSYQISDNAKYAIHSFENSSTPRRISLIDLSTHKEIKLLERQCRAENKV